MRQKDMPVIGITMGDPAGIGPEITCKCLAEESLYSLCLPLVIGSREPLERAIRACGLKQKVRNVLSVAECLFGPDTINLIEIPLDYTYEPGILKTENGAIAIKYMEKAHSLIVSGVINATASAPSNKEAMKMAGCPYTGATELYAHFAGDVKTTTVIEQGGCYIFQFTTHVPLRKALDMVTFDRIKAAILNADQTLRQWGFEKPRIAISGINPHAGEGGVLGSEEVEIMMPAVREASAEGVCIDGPIPADSIYGKGLDGTYDGIIMLFHDTANIPIKLMNTTIPSVVITSGLPFIRTTVAHGTAYDIAYKNIASHMPMLNCIKACAAISGRLMLAAAAAPDLVSAAGSVG